MNPATKRLIEHSGYYGSDSDMYDVAVRLVRLTVNDVLGVASQELHWQAYSQLLQKVAEKYDV